MNQTVMHYPTLKTVIMVENVLRKAETVISKNELLRRLPTKVMRQTLNVVLEYLRNRGMIIEGNEGILWTYNESPKLKRSIERGVEI